MRGGGDVLDRPLCIVLVEDDDGDAKAVTRAFAGLGEDCSIFRVRDGVEALALLRGESGRAPRTYVLIADLNLPRMGGIELLRTIRDDPDLRRAVAFVMTTSADDRDMQAAYAYHAAGYILKQNAGRDFGRLVAAIDRFWRLVELPDMRGASGE
ncbi:response regulator [Psychromarinibacter sp. S121]|uniref:response regulator n=1 Tax=Psychromarinibacter sp. S121 TaxID=3415127 RepID=UPI003C7A02F5